MTKVFIKDSENIPLAAIVLQNGNPIAAASDEGIVNLPEGNFEARFVGLENKPFSTSGSGEQTVTMNFQTSDLQGVEVIAEKPLSNGKRWLAFSSTSIVIILITYLLSK
jgi:hypothetical protein